MRSVALGSLFTLILSIGMFVSQVEAKNDRHDDKDKNKYEYKYMNIDITVEEAFPFPGPYCFLAWGLPVL
jgi:hypothetical protein